MGMVGKGVRPEIRKLQNRTEAETCARMMASSEPWLTLRRDFDDSLELISDPSREVYLAVFNGEIVGFIVLVMPGALVGYVQSIYVAEDWRGKGIGRQLMAFAEKRIFSEAPNVFICVSSFNKDAQRLYRRLGYRAVGQLKDYIIPGHSEILLRKTICSMTEFKKKHNEVRHGSLSYR